MVLLGLPTSSKSVGDNQLPGRLQGPLPPAVRKGPDGQPLFSWRVLILPYLEQDHLYRQFNLDEPWDSPHNMSLWKKYRAGMLGHLGNVGPPFATHYQCLSAPARRSSVTIDVA